MAEKNPQEGTSVLPIACLGARRPVRSGRRRVLLRPASNSKRIVSGIKKITKEFSERQTYD
jgi:hypothetical protein